MRATGVLSSLREAKEMSPVAHVHRPDPETAGAYRELAATFGRLYERLEPEFGGPPE